jgi:replicative DNA helicase
METPSEKPFVPSSLPFTEDGEKGVLCSLLLSPLEISGLCRTRLQPEAFYIPANRVVYNLVLEFTEKGKPVDFVTLKQTLKDRGQLEAIGGPEYLDELFTFVPTAANANWYIDIIRDKFQLRQLVIECQKAFRDCLDRSLEVENVLSQHAQRVADILDSGSRPTAKTFKEQVLETLEEIEQGINQDDLESLVRFGIPSLDDRLGGIQAGKLYLISAGTSGGKSLLGAQAVLDAGRRGQPVAIFSLEMTFKEVIRRMFARQAEVSMTRMKEARMKKIRLSDAEWRRLAATAQQLVELPIHLEDRFCVDIGTIISRIRELHARHKLSLVVVDYLQLIEWNSGNRNPTTEQMISEATRKLLVLAKQLGIAVIVMSQVNDEGALYYCKAIAFHADVWIRIEPSPDGDKQRRTIRVAKGRNEGQLDNITVQMDGQYMRFVEVEPELQEEGAA